jgi:hypothetical protein
MTEKYSSKQTEIVKGLVAIAKENELPIKEVMKTYNDFNHTIYILNSFNCGEFKVYDPKLEDITLAVVKDYFNFKKNELKALN